MIVVSLSKCPPKLRGDLSKWLLEVNTGVYVGHVSARVRDALWKRICDNIADGQATMVFNAQNEQHMDFYVHNSSWTPTDYDGIKLMKRVEKSNSTESSEVRSGFSDEAKRRMAKKRRNSPVMDSYIVLDIETTGLSPEKDEIIEIGIVEAANGKIIQTISRLIRIRSEITSEIQKLTGISNDMLLEDGISSEEAITEIFSIIEGRNVLIYNASFDMSFLEHSAAKMNIELPNIHIHDALALAKRQLRGLSNYKLDTVASHLNIKVSNRHRAVDDCLLLQKVYAELNKIQ